MVIKMSGSGRCVSVWCSLVMVLLMSSKVRSLSITSAAAANDSLALEHDRSGKFLFTLLKIQNTMCTVGDQMGTCVTLSECLLSSGTKIGHCAGGYGTCCYRKINCGEESSLNVTYIQNNDYPDYTTDSGTCTHNIKVKENICNLRLDFIDFELYDPYSSIGNDASNGMCQYDTMKVTGVSTDMFDYLCGKMPPVWHFYLGVRDGGNPVTFTFNLASGVTQNRKWNIKVTQISCERNIPQGCGHYFTGLEHDDIYSFNWGNNGMYLSGMNYAICYRQEKDYCTHSFTDQGKSWVACVDSLGFSSTDVGTNNVPIIGTNGVDSRDCNMVTLANVWPSPITTNNHGPTFIYFQSLASNSFRYLPSQPSGYYPGFHFSVTPNACT